MEYAKKKTTAQGRDTPVPVRESGDQTGRFRSSTSHREESPTDAQFGTPATGTDEIDPFRRRDSIRRSPPREKGKETRERSFSLGTRRVSNEKDEVFYMEGESRAAQTTEIGTVKRLREDSEDDLKELKKMFTKLNMTINDLTLQIQQNTRVEIKKGIRMVKGQADYIIRRWDGHTQPVMEKKKSKRTEERAYEISTGSQTNLNKPETKEVGVQTTIEEMPLPQKGRESGLVRSLELCDITVGWREVVRRRWHSEAYTRTEIKESKDILETEDAIPKVIFVLKGTNNQPNAEIWKRFPELLTIEEDCAVLEQTTNIKRENSRTATSKAIRIVTNGSEENLWLNLSEVKEETTGKKGVAILPLLGKTTVQLRKMVECIFHGTETFACLYSSHGERSAKKTVKQMPGKIIKEKNTCALVVEGTRKETYTDILKHVKEKIGGSTTSNKIRGLRSTRDGRLLITMDKDEEASDGVLEILGEMSDKFKVTRGGQRRQEVTLHIRCIDALMSKQELILAVEGKIGSLKGKPCRLSELRPNIGNTLAATLVMGKEDADKLQFSGILRIGYVNCQVERRVEVSRCFKCWEYTHKAKECRSNVDMSKKCYKCGEEGHNAKECTKEEFCPICVRSGHKADTIKCPVFRRALWSAKGKERERRANRPIKGTTIRPPAAGEEGQNESDVSEKVPMDVEYRGHMIQGPEPSHSEDAQEDDDEPGRGEPGRTND